MAATASMSLLRINMSAQQACKELSACCCNCIVTMPSVSGIAHLRACHDSGDVPVQVHHGNGTQHIFEEDPSVLYMSVHRHDG